MPNALTDGRFIWLDEQLAKGSTPARCSAKLLGVYEDDTHMVTISLVITHDGTEYRVVRLRREVNTIKSNDQERLRYLHRNMITHFLNKYRDAKFSEVVLKFLKWSTNPVHIQVLDRFI